MVNLDTDVSIVAGFVAILGGIGALFIKILGMASHYAKLELKVDTLWDFLMRRSLASGLNNDVLKMNSPVSATTAAEVMLEPMSHELASFYKNEGHKMTDRDLFIEIERRFGDRILKEVCIPHKLHQGECVFAAIGVAKKGL